MPRRWTRSPGADASTLVSERVDLVFDGIDTMATVRLRDGNELSSSAEPSTCTARTGSTSRRICAIDRSTLEVDLHSATAFATAEETDDSGPGPSAYSAPYNFVRKMACSFGWDWGPDLRTAGLWKPVRLERWSIARLAQVRPLVTVDADRHRPGRAAGRGASASTPRPR